MIYYAVISVHNHLMFDCKNVIEVDCIRPASNQISENPNQLPPQIRVKTHLNIKIIQLQL